MLRKLILLAALFATMPVRAEMTGCCYYSTNSYISTSASVSTTSAVIVNANLRRRGLLIYNNSSNSAYLTFGPVSVSATPTMILASFSQFSMLSTVVYQGQISAIRNAGTGAFTITELY